MKVISCEIEELYYVKYCYDDHEPYYRHHSKTLEELLEKLNNDIEKFNNELINDGRTDYLLDPVTEIVLSEDVETNDLIDYEITCKGNFVVLKFDNNSVKYVLV